MSLRDNKVDTLSTQNQDMRGRRIIGTGASVDPTDVVIQKELTAAINKLDTNLNNLFSIISELFKTTIRFFAGLITNLIAPPFDSATALQITKADKTTSMLILDTLTPQLNINTNTLVNHPTGYVNIWVGKDTSNSLKLLWDNSTNGAQLNNFAAGTYKNFEIDGSPLYLNSNSGGDLNLNKIGGKLSFFGGTAVGIQTLNAYVTNMQSSSYTGINNTQVGTVYAQVTDLNNLRLAYENLRSMVDDLRTKFKNTTLIT